MSNKIRSDARLRHLIAQESAKIIAEEGVKDFKLAKQKAAARLGIDARYQLPRNVEIEAALQSYQRLFKTAEYAKELKNLRLQAQKVLDFFSPFSPRLTGPTLSGIYSPHQEIHIHIFADSLEQVMFFLMDQHIHFEIQERRYRFQNNTTEYHPVLLFGADGIDVDVTVFTTREVHNPPLSPIDGKPMQRADARQLQCLLQKH